MRLDIIRRASVLSAIVIALSSIVGAQTARWLRTGVGAPGSGGFGAPPATCRITSGYTEVYVNMVTGSQYLCKNVLGVSTNLGTWQLVSGGGGGGTGDVVGPSSSADGELVLFSGSTGKVLRRSSALTGYVKLSSGVVSAAPIPASDLPTAVADGATKGVASFNAADFDASSGNISIDYTNGQAATGGTKGFLTGADWTTFNNKANPSLSNLSSVAINTTLLSDTDNTDDLGTSANRWRNLFLSGFVGDGSGNELLRFSPTPSAVNEFTIANAPAGTGPNISATGGDTNIDLNWTPKGSGAVKINGAGTSSVGIGDTDNSNFLKIVVGSNLTADRDLNFITGDAARNITITGDPTLVAGTMAITVSSGISVLGTSAIASGACATVVTTAATGTTTTDTIAWGFNSDPTGVTGYQASANGMLTIIAYPSANNVNFKVCNNTAASVTPGAVTLNWRVAR